MDPSVLVGCSEPALGISMLAQGFSSVVFDRTYLLHICYIFVSYLFHIW